MSPSTSRSSNLEVGKMPSDYAIQFGFGGPRMYVFAVILSCRFTNILHLLVIVQRQFR